MGRRSPLAEHVLGAAEANALRAVGARQLGLVGRVGVAPDLEAPKLIGPAKQLLKHRRHLAGDQGHLPANHVAQGAVDGDRFPGGNFHAADSKHAGVQVDLQDFAADHGGQPKLAGHDGRVAGRAPAGREDGLRCGHPVKVVRRGFGAHQDDRVAFLCQSRGIVGGQGNLASGGARRGVKPSCDRLQRY